MTDAQSRSPMRRLHVFVARLRLVRHLQAQEPTPIGAILLNALPGLLERHRQEVQRHG